MKEAIILNTAAAQERMPGHGLRLGAAKVWEEQDHRVPAQLLKAARNIDYRYWTAGDLQDQGATPHCVEYSVRGMLEGSPVRRDSDWIPRGEIYKWCQNNDEWAGTNYEGTSVHAGMKWLKMQGYVSSYRFARNIDELHAHLMLDGVAVAGTTWWEYMSYIDEFGYARIGGKNYGGHAYVIRGGNRLARDWVTETRGKYKIRNAWGLDYGEGGEAWITADDLSALIEDYGEIALPIEVKRTV